MKVRVGVSLSVQVHDNWIRYGLDVEEDDIEDLSKFANESFEKCLETILLKLEPILKGNK